MPRIRLPLATTLSRGRSTVAGVQGLVNLYAEPVKREGRTQLAIYPMPGKTLFSSIGGGSVRGQLDFGTYHAATVGTRLYTIASDGTPTDRGEIVGSDRNDLDYNGAQLFIQGIVQSYVYVPTTGVRTAVTDTDFQGASSACSLNGYTITTVPQTDRFQWFPLRDAGGNLDALDFATAESNGDINVAGRVANKTLHLFGEKTVEFYYHSGNPDQQFESRSIAPLEFGCLARDSIILCDAGFVWVGRDGKSGGIGVYRMAGGYSAKKISTPAVDKYLEDYATPAAVHALSFQFQGHLVYALHLPGLVSLYYDIATNEWGYLKSGTYPIGDEPLGGWDAISFATNGTKRIVGASDGNLYELDGTSNLEAGGPITREILGAQIKAASRSGAICHEIGIDMEVGVGLATGQGSDPKIMLSLSKDGGKTWGGAQERSLGLAGDYTENVFWTAQGQYQNLIPRWRVTDPVTFAAFDAYADVEPLA